MPRKKTIPDRIARMDRTANALLRLIENEKTTATQKGRLFAQVLNYYKLRGTLIPSDEGGKLKEMTYGIAKSSGRSGSSRADRAGSSDASGDGAAIHKLIASLPSFADASGGNTKGIVRKGNGYGGDAGSIRPHGGGDGVEHVDVAGDSRLV